MALSCASAPASRTDGRSPSEPAAPPELQILVTFEQRPDWRVGRAGSSAGGYSDGYDASARTRREIARLERLYALREVASWPIDVLGVHCVVFEAPSAEGRSELIERLSADDRVEAAQPLNLFSLQAGRYDDPYRELQHGASTLELEDAHLWADGSGVTVAVVDTGLDARHPDLAGRIRATRDFVDGGGSPVPDRHGTAVAGVIASTAGNGIGIVGVAPGVDILGLRACWPVDDGDGGACDSFTLAKALTFALERRVDVINLSLAGPADPLLADLVTVTLERGIVVVAAAADPSVAPFPGSVPGVVSVVSSPAAGGSGGSRPAAPGREIVTTVPGGGYDFLSGSSLAAAHVSGVAALLLQRSPRLSPERVARLLLASVAGSPPAVSACRALAGVSPTIECPGGAPRDGATSAPLP